MSITYRIGKAIGKTIGGVIKGVGKAISPIAKPGLEGMKALGSGMSGLIESIPFIGPMGKRFKYWVAKETNPDYQEYKATMSLLDLVKSKIMTTLMNLAKALHSVFMKDTMKNMDPAAAKRTKQMLGDPLNGQKGKDIESVYSKGNIALTNIESKKEKAINPIPRQDVGKVLEAASAKNAVDPMAMTQSGMGEIGKAVEKGRE